MSRVNCSASPMTWTTPTGVADLYEVTGTVSLARVATLARRGGRAVG
jgi:hypothetical protein